MAYAISAIPATPPIAYSKITLATNWQAEEESGGVASFYQWMIAEHGFKESQVKPYTFNPAPFLADKKSAQQGYVTAEPYVIEKQGGFKPNIFLLADYGYDTYATVIETTNEMIE